MISPADLDQIRTVIQQQIAAFQRDDAEGAFAFASPGIQAQFKTPEIFMQMVKASYAPVYRPRAVLFKECYLMNGFPAQPVMLMSAEAELVQATYMMEQQPDGCWRIQGCFLMPVQGRID